MGRFFETVMGVYFDELDPMNILHNARYLLLFERTLGAFWAEMGAGAFNDESADDRFHFVRANHIEYDSPVNGVGSVRVRVWVQKLGRTSLTFAFKIMPMDEDRSHATGSRTVVCVNPDSHRPRPWSAQFRERIGPWVNEANA